MNSDITNCQDKDGLSDAILHLRKINFADFQVLVGWVSLFVVKPRPLEQLVRFKWQERQ